MTPEESKRIANEQFEVLKSKIHALKWMTLSSPEGSTSYQGMGEGYIVTVMKAPIVGRGMVIDGMMVSIKNFQIIHFTPEMAAFCFEEAEKSKK